MAILELPHTRGCLVCGRDNPHGLKLTFRVDQQSGIVTTTFTPGASHIGFQGIVHGGIIATVLDEAMVWAATWSGRRFCVCGELTVRFRRSAVPDEPLTITATIDPARLRQAGRMRIVMTTGEVATLDGETIATASAKYVPLDPERNRSFVATLVDEAPSRAALDQLTTAARTKET